MNEITYRLIDDTTGAPVLGKASVTVVKDSGGTPIAGLTVTQVGSQGNYKITGFTDWYDLITVWIDGVLQGSYGIQNAGDPINKFINKSGTLAFTADQPMGSHKLTGLSAGTSAGHSVRFEQVVKNTGNENISGLKVFTDFLPFSNVVPVSGGDLINKTYLDVRTLTLNTIIVDGNAGSDITAIRYRTISDAVAYIHGFGSASTSNRWTILVYPKKSGVYVDAWIWYDWINIFGIGEVVIRNTDTFSLFVRSGTSNKVKARNLTFVQGDLNLDFHSMNLANCNFVSVDGLSDFGRLQLGQSQFKNCGIYYDYLDGYIVNDGGNRIISCHGNASIAWNTSTDDVYGYDYIVGAVLDF